MQKTFTIRDIASEAGVSIGTVSRVMNHAGNVDSALRERILSVMRKNHYVPLRRPRKNSRRNLAEGSRIAVLFFDVQFQWEESYHTRSYGAGITEVCAACGIQPEFFTLLDCRDDKLFRHLSEFDGILVKHKFLPGDERRRRLEKLEEKLPIVWFGIDDFNRNGSNVCFDNRAAGALAARELIQRGHRTIAFICTDPGNGMFRQREEGFRIEMEACGLWNPELLFMEKSPTIQALELDPVPPLLGQILGRILAHPQKVTAAVVSNDWGCVGLYRACAERGVRIPEELSIIGFDNQVSICCSLKPPLTSIDNPLADIGRCAMLDLLQKIDARRRNLTVPSGVRMLSGVLVERQSLCSLPIPIFSERAMS